MIWYENNNCELCEYVEHLKNKRADLLCAMFNVYVWFCRHFVKRDQWWCERCTRWKTNRICFINKYKYIHTAITNSYTWVSALVNWELSDFVCENVGFSFFFCVCCCSYLARTKSNKFCVANGNCSYSSKSLRFNLDVAIKWAKLNSSMYCHGKWCFVLWAGYEFNLPGCYTKSETRVNTRITYVSSNGQWLCSFPCLSLLW